MTRRLLIALGTIAALNSHDAAAQTRHTFALSATDFVLDGKSLQIMSGEIHPARVPVEYWRHRIQMAKAMGLNTIALYVMWNYHETSEGVFDFKSGNRDIAQFIRIAQEEKMWVLLRPGPYVCAEWDFGGIPTYLLRDPELRIRSMSQPYLAAADRYIAKLADVVRPLLVTHGGPILMVQVENEYGSYGNDRGYIAHVKQTWQRAGIDVPFYTGDGPTQFMIDAGHVDGGALGLDSGSSEKDWDVARALVPGVPIFSSETYPGWLTHFGEKWAQPGLDGLRKEMTFLLGARKSFNLYVVHGGTNFGFTAGANSGGKGYEPDVTSYDYDAPIDEQGNPTPKYFMIRDLILSLAPTGEVAKTYPAPIASMAIDEFLMRPFTSVWNNLPAPIAMVQPRTFEAMGQNQGLVLYRTTLIGRKSGKLTITDLHDFATVFVDGALVGTIDRRLGEKSIDLPRATSAAPVLEILVEGMGHINYGSDMIDRKGITDRVVLSGMTLMNWTAQLLPLNDAWVTKLSAGAPSTRPGQFFRGSFTLTRTADTYIDMTGYRKGVVWVNGHNLGRYWDIGPQMRLYVPASWLKAGANDVIVFDMLKTDAAPLRGAATLK